MMEVEKSVPEWMVHRDKVLASKNNNSNPSESVPQWMLHRNNVLASKNNDSNPSDSDNINNVSNEDTFATKDPARISNISGSNDTTPFSTESIDSAFGPDDDSAVLMSSEGSKGWSTPDDKDLSSSRSQNDLFAESHQISGAQHSNEVVDGDSTYDIIEESWRSEAQSQDIHEVSNDYEEVTLPDDDDMVPEDSPSNPKRLLDTALPPQRDTEPERSTHSAASFWGNPVRFANPFREKEDEDYSSEEAITDDVDPNQREPVGNKYMVYSTTPHSYDEDYDHILPDPPAALDGSIRKDKEAKFVNESPGSSTIKNPWMPPSDVGNENDELADRPITNNVIYQRPDYDNEEVLSMVTATIAETMEKLTQGENNLHAFTDASSAGSTTATHDPSAIGNGGALKRIDFAGQTTMLNGYVKKTHSMDENSQGSGHSRLSTSIKIRKYYDNGRDGNEDMRRLYMPTALPAIANPHKEEEKFFDWVPRKYKGTRNDDDSRDSISYDGSSVDERYNTTDDDNYESAFDDIEASRGIAPSGIDGGYSSVDIDIVGSDIVSSKRKGRAADGDMSAIGDGGVEDTVDTTALDTNNGAGQIAGKRFPCTCLNIWICLIIFLVPGIIFGIRYYPEWSEWFRNVFNLND